VSVTSQQPPAGPTRPRLIKRYANRKLYDTRDSRYVTLLQIAEYVRGGEEVSIIDNTTKEDLTNVTLAQIVYEEERKNGQAASRDGGDESPRSPTVGTLRTLIQQSGERLFSTLRGISTPRRDTDSAHPGEATDDTGAERPTSDSKPPDKPDEGRRLLVSPKEAWDELQRLADDRMKSVLGTAIGHVQQLQGEVKRLQGRIEELEQKLVAMSARDRAGKPADPSSDEPDPPR
jgi:hypothetical protein